MNTGRGFLVLFRRPVYTERQAKPANGRNRNNMRMMPLSTLAAVLLLAASLTPYLRGRSKAADLPSHFVAQYAVAGVFLCALCFRLELPVPLYIAASALGLCMMQLMPFLPAPGAAAPKNGTPLKILQVNVLKLNPQTEMLHHLILEEAPDVIVAAEVTEAFAAMFALLEKDYPYRRLHPLETSYGTAVLSRHPLEQAEHAFLSRPHIPADIFTIAPAGVPLTFCALHPPTPQADIAARNDEFDAVAARFTASPGNPAENLVVLGDFNATPWCPALRRMVKKLALKNTRAGRGIYGSWPSFLPLSLLRLPIDLVLYRGRITVTGFKTGPYVGSDHLPTLTELNLSKD
jgi:endonuclease/exonuclease/phosphatase (EEP) superfamily protein YafD